VSVRRSDTPNAALAARAFELALAEPETAVSLATAAIEQARRAHDRAELALAAHALGLALRYLERPQESVAALRRSIRAATAAGLVLSAGRARRSLAVSLSYVGRHRQALSALDQASAELTGIELDELAVQRGTVLWLLGRPAAVVETVSPALPALHAAGDGLWEARGLNALGLASVELGRFDAAAEAFRCAEELFAGLGQHADAAGNRHDQGWCAALLGDIPTALRHYEQAEQRFAALRLPLVEPQLDRARLLLAAGLTSQARQLTGDVAAELARRGAEAMHADALLLLSETARLDGEPAAAMQAAGRARALFRRQGRTGQAALAWHAQVRARWDSGERGPRLQREATRTAEQLAREGRAAPAHEALLLAGRLALHRGDHAGAAATLRAAAQRRRHGSAWIRSQAWLAEALLRLDRGDRRGAGAALLAGLRILEAYRTSLGAIELRAHVAAQADELVQLGRQLAVESGRPWQVLRWSEYGRASALRLPPVRPPADPELAAVLAELRLLDRQPATAARRRREAELRDQVRRRTYRLTGSRDPITRLCPAIDDIRPALGGRALVSICAVAGQLHAVVVAGDTVRLRPLGAADAVAHEARFLMMNLRRALQPTRPAASAGRALAELARAGQRLDVLLLEPLLPLVGGRDLLVVPPADLSMLPWHALPSAAGRAITIAPSVASWHAATTRPSRPGPVLLVAGPDLEHAEPEVRALSRLYPSPTVLAGADANRANVLTALDGAAVAHLAAHGEANRENPLFSAVRLIDGPLMAYDLERIAEPPAVVVLSACDSVASGVHGEELLGLAVVLLHGGCRSVIGTVAPLPDDAALATTSRLHEHIAAGMSPPEALAHSVRQIQASQAPPAAKAAALAFLAIGGTPGGARLS
jgi:tetratricopeptide (TPR) repeat protein